MSRQFIQIGIGSVCELIGLVYHGWKGVFIECHPYNFAQMCAKIHNEHAAAVDNINLILGAVSEGNGFYQVETDQMLSIDTQCNLPVVSAENDRSRECLYLYDIYGFSLGTLLTKYPNTGILMLDIQGAEYNVFKGFPVFGLSSSPSLLVVEVHGWELHRNLIELLNDIGYEYLGYRLQTEDRDRPNLFFEHKEKRILTHLSESERRIIGVQEIKSD